MSPLYNVEKRGMKLPIIGKIRKGEQTPVIDRETNQPKRKNGEIVMRPVERPHWVFSVDPIQWEDGFEMVDGKKLPRKGVKNVLLENYGTLEIKELNIYLALPDAYSNWSAWMEAYNYNQLIGKSDERVVTFLFDVETNEKLITDGQVIAHSSKPDSAAGKLVKNIPIGQSLAYDPEMVLGVSKTSGKAIMFKAVGRLNIVIKELKRLVTFTVHTGGYWFDIPAISTTIDILDSIAQHTGRGANTLPLRLRRVERERSYTDENGAKKKKVSYDIELEIRADITAGLLETYEESPFSARLTEPRPMVLPERAGPEPEEDFGESIADDGILVEEVIPVQTTEEMIDPLSEDAVTWAAHSSRWNMSVTSARKSIASSNNFYNPMPKAEFKRLVMEGKK